MEFTGSLATYFWDNQEEKQRTERLFQSIILFRKDVFKRDLKNVSDINNLFYREGETLLIFSVKYDRPAFVEILLQNGADVNLIDKKGVTPLHVAASKESLRLAHILLANNANIDKKGNVLGATPLMYAIYSSRVEMVSFLLKKGADKKIPNNKGDTPLSYTEFLSQDLLTSTEEQLVYKKNYTILYNFKSVSRQPSIDLIPEETEFKENCLSI